jgi:alpha-tubulin suppressor-like RCC1 family protein
MPVVEPTDRVVDTNHTNHRPHQQSTSTGTGTSTITITTNPTQQELIPLPVSLVVLPNPPSTATATTTTTTTTATATATATTVTAPSTTTFTTTIEPSQTTSHTHNNTTTTSTLADSAPVPPKVSPVAAPALAPAPAPVVPLFHTRRSRNSSSQSQQDPIIAPGFGTKRDLQRLARELTHHATSTGTSTTKGTTTATTSSSTGSSINHHDTTPLFTVDTIQYLMERRGRGVPKSNPRTGTDATSQEGTASASASASAAVSTSSSAWDDFMKEAGLGTASSSTATTTAVDTIVTGKRGRSQAATTTATTTTPSDATTATTASATSTQQRVYDLSALQLPLESTYSNKSKKSKTTGISTGGTLLQTGTLDVTIVGRKDTSGSKNAKTIDWEAPYTLSVPTRILPSTISIRTVIAAGHACHALAISTTGLLYGWGRNEQSQLTKSTKLGSNVYQPTMILDHDTIGPVHDAAVGKSHTIILFPNGRIMATGLNKSGQCGINNSGTETVSNFRNCVFTGTAETPKIAKVACGEDFNIVLDTEGYMYSCGSMQHGALANGTNGQYFITASKLVFDSAQSFMRRTTFCHAPTEKIYGIADSSAKVIPIQQEDIRVEQVVCGKHHCIALEAKSVATTNDGMQQRIFTWGSGDNMVLGHAIQSDEYFPRKVGALAHLRYQATDASVSEVRIAAGQHCSLLQTPNGHVYYWGKHRSVGEATSRPTLVDALANNGHVVSQIGAGGQTVFCCTDNGQTVSYGNGSYGELGFGTEKKSSAKPSFVTSLDGCHITSLACGYGMTLFVARDNGAEDRTIIETLPFLDPSVPEALAAAAAEFDDEGDAERNTKPAGRKGRPKKSS